MSTTTDGTILRIMEKVIEGMDVAEATKAHDELHEELEDNIDWWSDDRTEFTEAVLTMLENRMPEPVTVTVFGLSPGDG